MSVRKSLPLLTIAAFALALGACGGSGDGGGTETPTPAGDATATPVEEAPRTVTSDDGALTLEIPPGALGDETEVTITAVSLDELPQELRVLQGAGTGYQLEPDGLAFNEPATVRLELNREGLEGQAEAGITAYGLVSLAQDGERELLGGLVTEASLGGDKVTVSGQISHLSWLGRTRGSLTVTIEKVEGQQSGGTFSARAAVTNSDRSGAVTLSPTLGTFVASGAASVAGNPYFYRQGEMAPSEELEASGKFECGGPTGAGTFGVNVTTTSRVAVEGGEPIATRLTVVLDSEVECA